MKRQAGRSSRLRITKETPLIVFGMGPHEGTEEAWQRSRAQLGRALARRGWLNLVAVTVFGGVDPPGRGKGPRRICGTGRPCTPGPPAPTAS